ncbi:DMT family transporter [Streptosporangium lutulentum]|uniref:Multidrug transporter EmrE-like cation transporter n=1 Tax=Streptosporangium lutulentum TaxID=1461250 RepID=A0ABT9QUE9_9ACTN|nr:multidrug efflux SMR transporter [Streptosporangium lutulentum]MDP9850391.1 multidrug transporter EmrE-like cation transporter [Streptosporangium lutulentum]
MTAAWWFLTGAIVVEVASTSALKIASDGGGAPGWYVVPSLVGLVISYLLMSQSMSMGLKISVAYAVWSGLGTAAIAVIGAAFFGESLTPVKIVSIAVIIAGVVGLNLAPQQRPIAAPAGSGAALVVDATSRASTDLVNALGDLSAALRTADPSSSRSPETALRNHGRQMHRARAGR